MRSPHYCIKRWLLIVVPSMLTIITILPIHIVPGQGLWSWVTVKPAGESFSVRMPKQPSREPVEMPNIPNLSGTAYSATGGKIYYTVKSIRAERGGSPQTRLSNFVEKFREALSRTSSNARLTDGRPVYLSEFVGHQYRISGPSARGLVRIFSTEQRIYVLEVVGGDEEDAPVVWFLDSFTITEASRQSTPDNIGGGPERRLPPPPPTLEPTYYPQCACDPLGNPVDDVSTNNLITREALICTKGDLELTEAAVKHQFNGDVILEMEFLKNGTVGGIKVLQSQPYGLEQKAVEAARQYKFCPALQDGQPVDQITTFTARFSVRRIYRERPSRRPAGRRRP